MDRRQTPKDDGDKGDPTHPVLLSVPTPVARPLWDPHTLFTPATSYSQNTPLAGDAMAHCFYYPGGFLGGKMGMVNGNNSPPVISTVLKARQGRVGPS